jgi:hypothetical protein
VNYTSLLCYGLILVVKTLRKRFLNTNAAGAALAKYEALNNYPMTRKGVSPRALRFPSLRAPTCRGLAIASAQYQIPKPKYQNLRVQAVLSIGILGFGIV